MGLNQGGIIGLGMFVPEQVRTNDWWPADFVEHFNERAKHDVSTPEVFLNKAKTPAQRILFEHMLETKRDPFRGTSERRIAPPEMQPSDMEIAAARMALANAGISGADIDLLIVQSLPTDNVVPTNASRVQAAIGALGAECMAVDTGCASFLAGCSVADNAVRAGRVKYALVVCSSILSRLTDFNDPVSVNFADGAGAAVIGIVPDGFGFLAHASKADGTLYSGICVGPKSADLWYEKGGPFFLHSKQVEAGRAVVTSVADYAKDLTAIAMARANLTPEQITNFYSHQPVSFFSNACRVASGLAHAKTTVTFRKYASMGAANIPVNLYHAWKEGQLQAKDTCVLFGQGAGVINSSTVMRWWADA